MKMVEQILLLQLEPEMDGWSSKSFCQLCQKQHNLWKWDYALDVGLKFERAEMQMIRWVWCLHERQDK